MSIEDYERMRGAAWKRLSETIATARKQAAERGLTDELLGDEAERCVVETAIQGRIADRETVPPAGGRRRHRFPRSHGPPE